VALSIAFAVSGVLGDGTYATPAASAGAATALLGLSALETTGARPAPSAFLSRSSPRDRLTTSEGGSGPAPEGYLSVPSSRIALKRAERGNRLGRML
jgi:hypothetical protein